MMYEKDNQATWYIFSGNKLLVRTEEGETENPSPSEEGIKLPRIASPEALGLRTLQTLPIETVYGTFPGAEIAEDTPPPADHSFIEVRTLAGFWGEKEFSITAKAFQLINWNKTHRYCSRCAAPLKEDSREGSKVCPSCGLHIFPTISPAIIIAVTRGEKLLLAHNGRFPEGLYSLIAGFMEPGETIEACARREVHEETGIDIKNISYFGSQPWPFPHSLMIGLTGEYAGGEIRPDGEEILDARWFSREELPRLPGKGSISRSLIDDFLGQGG